MAEQLRPGVLSGKFPAMIRTGEDRLGRALEAAALLVESRAKINASHGGHRKGTKTPARPGSGPAVITGRLRASIAHTPVSRWGDRGLKVRVGTNVGYGKFVERGTSRMPAYPFLMPALVEGRAALRGFVREEFKGWRGR